MDSGTRKNCLVLVGIVSLVGCAGAAPPSASGAANASGSTPPATGSPAATPDVGPSAPEPPATPESEAGQKAFDGGNYADARKSFEAAVKKNPKDYTSYIPSWGSHARSLASSRARRSPTNQPCPSSPISIWQRPT